MADALTLTPFLEPEDPDEPGSDRFVAGFKDATGDRWGVVVPIDRETVTQLVLTSTPFELHIEADGSVQAWPDLIVVDDEIAEEMLAEGLLPKKPIDELVAQIIELNRAEPNDGEDGVLPEYAIMRKRLAHALELVDAEIKRRLGSTGG